MKYLVFHFLSSDINHTVLICDLMSVLIFTCGMLSVLGFRLRDKISSHHTMRSMTVLMPWDYKKTF